MSNGDAAGYAAMIRAVKAMGAIIKVRPDDFSDLLRRLDRPLIVEAYSMFPGKKYRYLTTHKGFVFFTKSATPLQLPAGAETVSAKRIWVPT